MIDLVRSAVLAGLILASAPLFAMQCFPPDLDSVFESADAVFEGIVVSREKVPGVSNGRCWEDGEQCGKKIAEFNVGKVWKGELGEVTGVSSGDACYCLGNYFQEQNRYIVFAKLSDDPSDDPGDDSGTDFLDMESCTTRGFEQSAADELDRIASGVAHPPTVPSAPSAPPLKMPVLDLSMDIPDLGPAADVAPMSVLDDDADSGGP